MTGGLIRPVPGELPGEVTGFVGRRRELAVLDGLLVTARLVTVTGPGGVGKTRLALRAAARARGRFADGAFLAELGGLHDPGLLPHTVASCLGLPEQDARAQADAIVDYLRFASSCHPPEPIVPGRRGDAVELFAQRATAASPGFAVTAANRATYPVPAPGRHPAGHRARRRAAAHAHAQPAGPPPGAPPRPAHR